jgi:RNA polymerase sigma factor (TIGR02999 family)
VGDVTQLLGDINRGSTKAADELLDVVYGELRKRAAYYLGQERPGQTLQPTALVHEAWLRLGGSDGQQWTSEGHFLAAATTAMRRILIDRARSKARVKHGERRETVNLDDVNVATTDMDADTLLAVNDALDKLAREDPEKAKLVEMRFFVGMSIPEAGKALGISESTAKRQWAYARAWLYDELSGSN